MSFTLADSKIYVTGAATGIAYVQSSPTKLAPGDVSTYLDLTNAQIAIQKTDGWLQFYAQVGNYSFPTVGTPYTKSSVATPASFGVVPVAYLKLQGEGGLSNFSIQAGKLVTLVGDEYNFTFQNMNIERGLLWNIEPAISRGFQVNYSNGPLSASVAFTDGYYTNRLNTVSGFVGYTFSPSDTLAFSASGSLGNPYFSPLASGSIYNLIWTHTMGSLTISPYFQYSMTPSVGNNVLLHSTIETGEAILASYSFDDNFKLAARFEYENSTGIKYASTPNVIGFGPGSNAFSITITPTFQYSLFFIRPEFSYVSAGNSAPGSTFGTSGTTTNQVRGMIETGIVF
jgi:hypothetical protein